jgi:hypothetical protein
MYAEGTAVPVERSRAEIEGMLRKYGADGFRYGWMDRDAKRIEQIEFGARNRLVRFNMKMPSQHEARFKMTENKPPRARSPAATHEAWDRECRRMWRALALCIKAKLEAVASGISHFEEEFMAQIVDPVTNRTIGQLFLPQLDKRYLEGPKQDLGVAGFLPATDEGPGGSGKGK